MNRVKALLPSGIGANAEGSVTPVTWKQRGATTYMATVPLYIFPLALSGGASSALMSLLYSVGGLDSDSGPIAAMVGGTIAVCCLASIAIWGIIQEVRLKNIGILIVRHANEQLLTVDFHRQNSVERNPVDLAAIRISKFLVYLTARRV